MSVTPERWTERGVYNSHMLVTKYALETQEKGVYLGQSANDGSRMSMGVLTGYYVYRPGFKTDPDSKNWLNHGNKSFSTFSYGYDWKATLEAASAWARERYGVGEFVAIPGFGRDRFPKEIADWAKAELKKPVA